MPTGVYKRKKRIKIKCLICGRKVYTSPAFIKRERKYCSNKCKGIGHRVRRPKRKCSMCGKTFIRRRNLRGKNSFCSQKCYWDFRKLKKGTSNPNWKGGYSKCSICGEALTRYKKNTKCKECHLKTYIISFETRNKMSLSRLKEKNPNWRGGIQYEPYSAEFNDTLKELIRQRDGYKCQMCGVSQMECIKKLSIHHIDYNKLNSNPKNLISLCEGCHTKTHYKQNYWRKYFNELIVDSVYN
jgi:endogenous inhibitor of DNA gyrase (YacG/DUF329 family)